MVGNDDGDRDGDGGCVSIFVLFKSLCSVCSKKTFLIVSSLVLIIGDYDYDCGCV